MIELINHVCINNAIDIDKLLSKSRRMPLPQFRAKVFAAAYKVGYSQVQIAERFGITRQGVSKAIANSNKPNYSKIKCLSTK